MTFDDAADRFQKSESGTDSFKLLYKAAFDLMIQDPAHAAFYFVIGVAAHNYVMQYADQGVTPEFANKARGILIAFNNKISQALTSSPDVALRLLGEVSSDYQFNVREF
ncbi:MAG: hypothetical protein JWP47_850 [Polaromonas sp.]|jgi:hypothetical protein|nr:hypothetical protein [Polaromonas sp.]